MINKLLNFIFALILTSFVLFILFDKIIMPTYIRKDKTITVMDLKGKNLDLAMKQLESEGFKGTVFDTVYTSELNPSTIVDQYPCLLYTSPSPRDMRRSRMPSSA